MSNERQINYVNEIQNRVQNLYYIDDATELNSIDLRENDKIYAINDNKLFQMEIVDQDEELSGSIVSFNGRNNTKIKSVVTNIEPVQDLHGYDHPWPASGGKNKYNKAEDYYGQSKMWSTTTHAIVDSTLEYYASPKVSVLPSTQYTRSAGGTSTLCFDSNGDWLSNIAEGNTFTTPSGCYYIAFNVPNNINHDTVQLELGSSSTSYAPYENICPINGWTGANIYHEETYDASATPKLNINWQTEAGTIYGGTLDVTSGKLVVDRAINTMAEMNFVFQSTSNRFYTSVLKDVIKIPSTAETSAICESFIVNPWNQRGSTQELSIAESGNIFLFQPIYTSVEELNAAVGGTKFCYELATPIEYQLTPYEVTTLLGTNNIWSDIGDITVKIAEKGITAFELKPYN